MYLTKFPLNLTRRETRGMLADPYKLHAAIAASFPGNQAASEDGRVLWRIDRNGDGSQNLFIVSPTTPSLVGLNEQIGWPDLPQQWQTRDYEPFLASIDEGQLYGFRLVANPVVNRAGIRNKNDASKRIPHLTELQQKAWLVGRAAYDEIGIEPPEFLADKDESRAASNGFEVVVGDASNSLQVVVSDTRKLVLRQGKQGNRITLATARYDGVLRVTDVDLLRHALTHGIGHAKGFGCGLLTLAKVSGT